ncbi:MAG: L-threonylcarbamoyladenylate synthase [Desulfobulbaceae bacterium]|nr:L-threonylcarbamoyladenylate synthase [Desulfobulbaceae bacterium]
MSDRTVSENEVIRAAEVIRKGGVVAFPTETYYGLAVDPLNGKALQKLFKIKDRPALKPVLLLIADRSQLGRVTTSVPELAARLMDRFWPGPLTLVLPARPELSSLVTGNTGTVGVRLSPHPVAAALLKACGIPLTATSANRSGEAPAVTAEDVRAIFGSQIDFVLDGGKTPGKLGSTLVGFKEKNVQCIREGCIPFQDILDTIRHG